MTIDSTPHDPVATTGRGAVPGLRTPFPMVDFTPAMLAEDPLVREILGALDEGLAPIISTLDCFDAYLDPHLAPMDFVAYLSSWLLVSQEEGWDDETRRTALAMAIQRSTWRGTAHGIEARLASLFGMTVSVEDSGSVTTSRDFTPPELWTRAPAPEVTVTLPSDGPQIDLPTVRTALSSVLPAHVGVTLQRDDHG